MVHRKRFINKIEKKLYSNSLAREAAIIGLPTGIEEEYSKMKRFILLISGIMCLSLCACQPTPEEPFVVNKGDGTLMSIINGEPAQTLTKPYSVPETWQETIDGKIDDRLMVEVDAKITVPDVLEYPVYSVIFEDYDQEMFENFLNNTVGDVDLFAVSGYMEYKYASTHDAQQYLDAIEYMLDDQNSPFNKYCLVSSDPDEKSEANTIKNILLKKQDAYDYILHHQSDLMTKVDRQYASIEKNSEYQQKREDGTIAGQTARWFTKNGNSKIYIKRIINQTYAITYEPEGVSTAITIEDDGSLAKTTGLRVTTKNIEDAQNEADIWCEKLGLDDWTLVNIGSMKINTLDYQLMRDVYIFGYEDEARDKYDFYKRFFNHEMEPEAYLFTYTPAINDVPTLYFSNKLNNIYGNKDWYMPYLQVVVDDSGVRAVKLVNGNSYFDECINTNVELLPFEKIQQKFRDYIVMNTNFTGTVIYDPLYDTYENYSSMRTYDGHEMTRIHIDDIRLGYIKVKKINSDDYMAIPAWCFYGQEYNRFSDDVEQLKLYENNETRLETFAGHSFLCINAIDGSIIDLTQGY